MLEAHIMQAQAAATAADERELQRATDGYDKYHSLGLPPGGCEFAGTKLFSLILSECQIVHRFATIAYVYGHDVVLVPTAQSNLRFHLDTQLLKKFNLIIPEDFISESHSFARPPQGTEV